MRKIFLCVILSFLFSGCVTLRKAQEPDEGKVGIRDLLETSPALENIKTEELQEYVQKKGVIFAKTDFQGLLETDYVQFLFEDLEDPTHKFFLHIGEKSGQKTFPWEGQTVKPGYFFIELPVGKFKIASVSIPVGSTLATEDMNVTLEVLPDTVCYVGTLKMVGTKEKIKLGGLPVIKPGFEFTVEVLDQHEEGLEAFRKNYPNFSHEILIKIMEVVKSSNAPEG